VSHYADQSAFPRNAMATGLTRREYFVAAAMQGLCAAFDNYRPGVTVGWHTLAEDAERVADAQLARLEKKA
jgi:hypothetical protein